MVLETLVLVTTVAVVAGAKGAEAHRRFLAGRTLERYARVRGHAFAPEAPAKGRRSPRVDGIHGDGVFAVDLCRIGSRLSTRVSAAVVRPPAPRFALVQRSRLARALDVVDPDGVLAWDDPRLGDAYRVRGVSPAEGLALFEPHRACLRALDERSHVWVSCDGGLAQVTWAGVETDPSVLDAARDLVLAASRWHRAPAPYR